MMVWQAFGMARKRTKLAVSAAQAAQLKEQIRAAGDPRDKERLQVVQWATSGQHSLAELAQLAGRARSTIQVWLDDFTAGGVARLLERTPPPGKPSLVAGAKVQAELKAGLRAGHWRTAGQVAAWLQEKHGIKRAAKSLYYWLGKVGGALRVPRPCHVQQNPVATAAFRAELEANLEKLELPKDRPVKIWVADEARFGLHTQSRRCWAVRGQRVVIPQQQRYEWEYVYGALEVLEGDAQFRFMPAVNLEFSRDFLQQIAASDPAAEHVVIQDQAGFHPRTGDAGLPGRIHLLPLPPYSPELNPIEGLWDQVQDVTCNRRHESLDDLEQTLTNALRPFWETPARVLSLIHHWLQVQANATP
jgi:transposase